MAGEPDLLLDIRRAVRADHPLELLALASTLLEAARPARPSPFETAPNADEVVDLGVFVTTLLDVNVSETTALLTALAAMADDDLLRARISRELAKRHAHLPVWLRGLDGVQVYRAVEMVEVFGDGDDVMLGIRFPSGAEMTVVVYIDHNLGSLVKDAFVVEEPIADVVAFMQEKDTSADTAWNDVLLADARARIDDAIALGAITYPPFESDSWPACRPLVEWLTRDLPAGGAGYVKPEWDDAELQQIADRFFASPFGSAYDDAERRDLLDSLLWYGSGYGPCDPLRWSPTAVEILLTDWIPRKIVADADHLAKAPELLRAFIRFCHDERGIRAGLTANTLEAVDGLEPEYQRLIRSPRPQGPAALVAAMLSGTYDFQADAMSGVADMILASLRARVGGDEELRILDDDPLPDEDFQWEGVPADVRPAVDGTLALVDACCTALFDTEFRTACRRFLSHVAGTGPDAFRGRAGIRQTAAAVCWAVGKANDAIGRQIGDVRVKDLMAHFGLGGSPAQRAGVLLRAGGFGADTAGDIVLSSPRYLVSSCRRGTLETRDYFSAHPS